MRAQFEGGQGLIRAKASAWFREAVVRGAPKETERLSAVHELLQEAQTEMATPVALKGDDGNLRSINISNNVAVMRKYGFEVADDAPPETFLQIVADKMLGDINHARATMGEKPYSPEKAAILVVELSRVINLFKGSDHDRKGSGEKYYWHQIGVVNILVREMNFTSLKDVVALLHHDTLEDIPEMEGKKENLFLHPVYEEGGIPAIRDEIHERMEEIGISVEALTKLTHTKEVPDAGAHLTKDQKQEIKTKSMKALLSMASKKDMRIVIFKIADRLFNMRDMEKMTPESQESNARETLAVYVPLADALGFKDIANELLCLSLRYLKKQEVLDSYKTKVKAQNKRMEWAEGTLNRNLSPKNCTVKIAELPFSVFWGKWIAENGGKSIDDTLDLLSPKALDVIKPNFSLHTITITLPDESVDPRIIWAEIANCLESRSEMPYKTSHGNMEVRALCKRLGHQHIVFKTEKQAAFKKRGYIPLGREIPSPVYRVAERIAKSWDPGREQILPMSVRIITPEADSFSFPPDATVLDYIKAVHSDFSALAQEAIVSHGLHFFGGSRTIPLTDPLSKYHNTVIEIRTRENSDDIAQSALARRYFFQSGNDRIKFFRIMSQEIRDGKVVRNVDGSTQKIPETTLQARGSAYWDDLCSMFSVEAPQKKEYFDKIKEKSSQEDCLQRIGCAKADPLRVFLDDPVRQGAKRWNMRIFSQNPQTTQSILGDYIKAKKRKGFAYHNLEASTPSLLSLDFSSDIAEENRLLRSLTKGDKEKGERYRRDRLLEPHKIALALYMEGAKVTLTAMHEEESGET